MRSQPPDHVLGAYGVGGSTPVPLRGGEGTSWRAGDLVFKPVDVGPSEMAWLASTFSRLAQEGFRVARPRAATDGTLSVDGWTATEFVPGSHHARRWPDIIAAGERLHRALRYVERPEFLDHRTDRWSVADRVAWDEIPAACFAEIPHISRLAAARRPVAGHCQVIHGDLTGNVLFDDQLPPAIIDFSAYWRPAAYASAIVVADALAWEGADEEILRTVRHVDDFGQYLVRALIFRIVSDQVLSGASPGRAHGAAGEPYQGAVDLAVGGSQ